MVAFPRCDAAAGRPGGCEQFPCLGNFCMTPGRAFNQITLLPRCLHAGDCGFGFVSYTESRPRLGLAARSRVATHPGVWGFCRWAGELTGRQAAESPSRRATERASARNSSSPCPYRPQDRSRRAPRMRSQDSAVSRLSPSLIAHSLTRLAICSGRNHPGFCRRNHIHHASTKWRCTKMMTTDVQAK